MTEHIDTIQDLIHILATHPEWRVQLRPLILTDDFLTLPEQVRALTDRIAELAVAQGRTEQTLNALATAQAQNEHRFSKLDDAVAQLIAAQARNEHRFSKLDDAVAQLIAAQAQNEHRFSNLDDALARNEQRFSNLDDALAQLIAAYAQGEQRLKKLEDILDRSERRLSKVETDVAVLKGDVLELQFGKRVVFAYGRWLRRSRILSHEQVYELLDDAVDAGHLTMDERDQIAQADVFVQGRDKDTGEAVHLVVEVSWGVGVSDVERAAERAALLAKIGTPTRAAVVGRVLMPEAEEQARALGVWSWITAPQGGARETANVDM